MARNFDFVSAPQSYGKIPDIPETTINKQIQDWTTSLPNYGQLSQQASDVTGQMLSGQVPRDVITQLQQQAAERGIATGMPDSPNTQAAYLRLLGLTSLGMQQQGQQAYTNLLQASPRTTTQQQIQDNNVLRAMYAAAPNPYFAAMANLQAQQGGLAAGGAAAGSPRATAPIATLPQEAGYQILSFGPAGTYTGTVPDYNVMTGQYEGPMFDQGFADWYQDVAGEPYAGYTYMGEPEDAGYADWYQDVTGEIY